MSQNNVLDWSAMMQHAECLIDEDAILTRIGTLADQINKDFSSTELHVLCVMNGGLIFCGHLLTRLQLKLSVDYVDVSRYGNATEGGQLNWRKMPTQTLSGRSVLLIDDILDEGITMQAIREYCRTSAAASVHVVTLLQRKEARKNTSVPDADYYGFEVDAGFLIGFGMDYQGRYRNLPGIYRIPTRSSE